MNDFGSIIFYTIEKAIKTYRQFAQRRLVEAGSSITVDQWLLLNMIDEHPGMLQGEIAELVFKDKASIARTVDLLVNAALVERAIPANDRRTVRLKLTRKGRSQIKELSPVVASYRKQALKGFTAQEMKTLDRSLQKLITNCHE